MSARKRVLADPPKIMGVPPLPEGRLVLPPLPVPTERPEADEARPDASSAVPMESIGAILPRILQFRRTATGTVPPRPPEPEPCPRCAGIGYLRVDTAPGEPGFGETVQCGCKAEEIRERRAAVLAKKSNLASLAGSTFATYLPDPADLRDFTVTRRWADHPRGLLIIMGGVGAGKTHIAAAIGNYRLALGDPVLFQVVPDLLDHLRAAYGPTSEVGYDGLFDTVQNAPLLILDDLGTQVTTPWAGEKLFQLFNHRYTARLATVITTNVSLEEIGSRLASRMADPQVSTRVTFFSQDSRSIR